MVSPQAILAFLPITTPGKDAMLNPETSNGQALDSTRQCNPTWANIDGIEVDRCGSLPKIAWPLAVPDPAIAQELEPVAPPPALERSTCGIVRVIFATPSSALEALRS